MRYQTVQLIAGGLALTLYSTSVHADLRVVFDEGAPKDRFRIENTGPCTFSAAELHLDLSTSSAGLIFDVTAEGAGVEVFQPFEVVSGQNRLADLPVVRDGQSRLTLRLNELAPKQAVVFTIDVDDTKGQRNTMVSGAEIEGASVAFTSGVVQVSALFSDKASAAVSVDGCSSRD